MRAALILPAVALGLSAAIVVIGGRMVATPVVTSASVPDPTPTTTPAPPAVAPALPSRPPAISRQVAPKIVAPPELDPNDLEREPAREPLSDLSLALPPEPEISAEWSGTTLYRPLATESAIFESMGHTVAIAGTRSVALDETCSVDGVSWRCGIRARTAFRLWLRGRALICALPDEKDVAIVAVRCRLGKQDAGAWLVSNGWARAVPDGPYAKAEERAKSAKMGIFGPPPDTSGLSDVPDAGPSAPLVDQPVLSDQGIEPEPAPEPLLEFLPPPPAP